MSTTTYRPTPATQRILANVQAVLDSYDGEMTLRQVYYQLVARFAYENTERKYKALSVCLTRARVAGIIDGSRIVDRTRTVLRPYGFEDLPEFLSDMRDSYQRPRWQGQRRYVEVWVEKDALAGVFEPITCDFGVRLAVCRGYPSYPAIREAALRFLRRERDHQPMHLLYFGDFDPSGQDIPRAVRDNLHDWFGITIDPEIIALTGEQVEEYGLPPVPAKRSDSRARGFIERHGDRSVELDALPPDVLQGMIQGAINRYCDAGQREAVLATEAEEIDELGTLIDSLESDNGGGS